MINTLAITLILTCSATIAYGITEIKIICDQSREEKREAKKAEWRRKYRQQIVERRTIKQNREELWEGLNNAENHTN